MNSYSGYNEENSIVYNNEADQSRKSSNYSINQGFEGDRNISSDDLNKLACKRTKKRKRISLSCLNCKRRKVKCDRRKPICTSCNRNRIPAHLCVYKESPHILTANLSDARKSNNLISPSNHEIYDLTDFALFKYKKDILVYLGPTCWKTILFQAFKNFDIKEILKRTHEDFDKYLEPVGDTNLILSFSITETIKNIPVLLPSYKEIVSALTMFLQMPNVEVHNCISYESLFNYLQAVIIPNQSKHKQISIIKNCSLPKLSIILYVYAIASWNNSDIQSKLLPILQSANHITLSNYLQTDIPTLLALTLMHYCNKNKYNTQLKYSLYHDQSIFPPMVSIAISLGLNRYQTLPDSGLSTSEFKALGGIWKYLLLEDTKRSFQRGCQPLIQDICWNNNLLEEEWREESTYNERIKLLSNIVRDLSLPSLSKKVSLDAIILQLDYLIRKSDLEVDTNFGGYFQQSTLISLIFLQCLSNIRYVKVPTIDYKIDCFKYSLTLFLYSKEIFSNTLEKFDTPDENEFRKHYSDIGYLNDLEEAICRCGQFFISVALNTILQEDFPKHYMKVDEIGFEVSYANLEKLFSTGKENISSVINNFNWLISFINRQLQPLLSEFAKFNISAKSPYVFIGHAMNYIDRELKKISEVPNLVSSQYSLDETNIDIMSIFEPSGITKEELLELLMI